MAQPKNPKTPSEWLEDEVPSKLPLIPLVSSVLNRCPSPSAGNAYGYYEA